jgi:MFS transporter, DHA1 family, inner membrane transport protein
VESAPAIETKRVEPGLARVVMFAVLLGSYVVNAMDRQLFPLVAPEVRREYGFSLAGVGLLSTVFTLGMAVAGVPTGFLLARFSRRAVLQTGIALFSAGTALTVVSRGFADMLLYRTATGVGEAMQLTVLLAIAANYFAGHRAAALGAVNFSFAIGAILGPMLGGALLGAYGTWRVPMLVFAALGFAAIAVIASSVDSSSTGHDRPVARHADDGGAATLVNRNTVLLTVMSLLGGLVIYGYLGLYPTFLREGLGYSPAAAGSVMGLYGLGALMSIAGGWIGDRGSPRFVLSVTFAAAAMLGYLLFNGSASYYWQAILSFAWGVVVSGVVYVNLAGYHVKAVRRELAGRASGVFVTSLYLSAAVAGYLMGWIANRAGWGAAGSIQISLCSLAAALLALALRGRPKGRPLRTPVSDY